MSNGKAACIFIGVVIVLCAMGGKGTPPSSGNLVTNYIQQKFGVYSSQALTIAKCESGYDPLAYDSTPVYVNGVPEHAMGVFQIIPSTFSRVSTGNVYNYQDNIDAAYQIFSLDGYSWREWECKPW